MVRTELYTRVCLLGLWSGSVTPATAPVASPVSSGRPPSCVVKKTRLSSCGYVPSICRLDIRTCDVNATRVSRFRWRELLSQSEWSAECREATPRCNAASQRHGSSAQDVGARPPHLDLATHPRARALADRRRVRSVMHRALARGSRVRCVRTPRARAEAPTRCAHTSSQRRRLSPRLHGRNVFALHALG